MKDQASRPIGRRAVEAEGQGRGVEAADQALGRFREGHAAA
ncbi:MAG TPA: hypothetical protein VLA02_06855 [Reyranella sp.]|nr:hypothetical protein [Reyranella sp.]